MKVWAQLRLPIKKRNRSPQITALTDISIKRRWVVYIKFLTTKCEELNMESYSVYLISSIVITSLIVSTFDVKNYFRSSRGSWGYINFETTNSPVITALGLFTFLALMVGFVTQPSYERFSLVYLLFFLGSVVVYVGVIAKPELYPFAIIGNFTVDKWSLWGVLYALGLIFLGRRFPLQWVDPFLNASSWMVLAAVVFVAVLEEWFFSGMVAPSMAESFGIVGAFITSGAFFGLLHLRVYNADFAQIVVAISWRIVADALALKSKSLIPGILGHLIINLSFFV